MKFSLRFNNDLRVSEYVEYAQMAEAAGFDQFWVSHDLFIRSAPVILTAIAAATKRINIGTGILNPYTMNPAEIAMFAATLDEFSGGRFRLGLSSGANDFLKWVGIDAHKPVTAIRETISAVSQLLTGERVACVGDFLQWTDEAYLRFPARRVPIYIGAMSPNMLRAIGEIADGGLPLLFPPEHYETVLPYIQEGADAAGRDMSEVDVAACVWCSLADDRAAAEDALKEKIAYYGHALGGLILERLGLTVDDFTEIEQAVMVENDIARAKSLVTAPMLKIGVAGTAYGLIERLEGLVAMGVRHLSFGPPLGPDVRAAIDMLGREVLPHFRAKDTT